MRYVVLTALALVAVIHVDHVVRGGPAYATDLPPGFAASTLDAD